MKKIAALVLSSGGARGIAHIGVIEELERQGFEIKSIAGSSMGALVGGIYATGRLNILKEKLLNLDRIAALNLIDFTLSNKGIVKGNKIIKEINQIIPDVLIEELPVLYTAVASDVKNRQEIIFNKGRLYEAIRASIAIPAIFTPVRSENKILVDGGVINPLPINRVNRMRGDILIAVNVNAANEKTSQIKTKKLNNKELTLFSLIKEKGMSFLLKTNNEQFNFYTLLSLSASIMIQQVSRLTIELYKPDILIDIPMDSFGPFQFYKANEIIKAGEIATNKALTEYQNKLYYE